MNDTNKLGRRVDWWLAFITTIVVVVICLADRM